MNNDQLKAVEILKHGGVVVFPTDTAYGVGCRIDDEFSVKRIFEIRKRDEKKPLLVLVSSIEMAQRYLQEISPSVLALMEAQWPGGLTIVYPCKKEKVLGVVRANGETLAVRFPNNTMLLEVIEGLGVPLVAPSANFSGESTPLEYSDIDPEFLKLVDFSLQGECTIKGISTIVDCSVEPFTVLRKGVVEL